jgi:hypothetical protein
LKLDLTNSLFGLWGGKRNLTIKEYQGTRRSNKEGENNKKVVCFPFSPCFYSLCFLIDRVSGLPCG